MNNAERVTYGAQKKPLLFNASLNYIAVFIVFAVIATLLCGSVPAASAFLRAQTDQNDLTYAYVSVPLLFADAFDASVTGLILIFFTYLTSFSLLSMPFGCFVCSFGGLFSGILLFYTLSGFDTSTPLYIHTGAYVLTALIITLYCSSCSVASKRYLNAIHTNNRRMFFKSVTANTIDLFITCGAICTVNLLKLITSSN